MTFFVGCTEAERDRIIAENNKESRELILTEFKQGQEYQFGEIPWNSSVEEVEDLLNCTLKDVTVVSPEKDYLFYDFLDAVYVLDGHEAEASIEFRADKLVFVDFKFKNLEDPKGFFEEIVTVWQDQYGPETRINQNETTGTVSYQWRTENTQMAIGFYGEPGEWVVIYLAFLK